MAVRRHDPRLENRETSPAADGTAFDDGAGVLLLAMLWAGLAATPPVPCAAPVAPRASAARWLLPRLIVEAGTGPVVAVKLSWRIGSEDRGRPGRQRRGDTRPARGPMLPDELEARLVVEEAEAMETASRCP